MPDSCKSRHCSLPVSSPWDIASQVPLVVKNLPANEGDLRDAHSMPGLGRSPAGRHVNPFQHSCLENPMDRSVSVHLSVDRFCPYPGYCNSAAVNIGVHMSF